MKVKQAGTEKVKIRPNAKAKRILRTRRKLPIVITLTFKPTRGRTSITRLSVTLRC